MELTKAEVLCLFALWCALSWCAAGLAGWERRSLNGAGWGGIGHNGAVYGTNVAVAKHLS